MSDPNVHVASDEESIEATIARKDEQMPTTVHETGYESECSSSSRSEADVARSALQIEADAFTRFIERQRIQTMFELRHLRLGERPVTGQPNRERIETFLNNIQEQQQQQQVVRAPSTRPVVPSAHIADINALSNRRCVSAALGSAAFRRDLENAVRRSIETRPVPTTRRIPLAPPLPRTLATTDIEQPHSPMAQNPPTSPVRVALARREPERLPNAQPSMYQPFNLQRQERELNAWETITQLQREIIVLEISDLVHRQLVTSALESDFRTHLEQNILTRLEQGTPPQPAQDPAPIVIPPRLRPMPVPIRTTAHNSTTASTMDELSSRLDNMQHMLQLMFSMQLDMQRSLRQEVASSMASNSLTTMASNNHPVNAGHCTICLTATADTVLYRCGHLCVCYTCGLSLRETTSTTRLKCPICRAPVDDILRVYRSSHDEE